MVAVATASFFLVFLIPLEKALMLELYWLLALVMLIDILLTSCMDWLETLNIAFDASMSLSLSIEAASSTAYVSLLATGLDFFLAASAAAASAAS